MNISAVIANVSIRYNCIYKSTDILLSATIAWDLLGLHLHEIHLNHLPVCFVIGYMLACFNYKYFTFICVVSIIVATN